MSNCPPVPHGFKPLVPFLLCQIVLFSHERSRGFPGEFFTLWTRWFPDYWVAWSLPVPLHFFGFLVLIIMNKTTIELEYSLWILLTWFMTPTSANSRYWFIIAFLHSSNHNLFFSPHPFLIPSSLVAIWSPPHPLQSSSFPLIPKHMPPF